MLFQVTRSLILLSTLKIEQKMLLRWLHALIDTLSKQWIVLLHAFSQQKMVTILCIWENSRGLVATV